MWQRMLNGGSGGGGSAITEKGIYADISCDDAYIGKNISLYQGENKLAEKICPSDKVVNLFVDSADVFVPNSLTIKNDLDTRKTEFDVPVYGWYEEEMRTNFVYDFDLSARTKGAPLNTATANTTKRIYPNKIYVCGITGTNYYTEQGGDYSYDSTTDTLTFRMGATDGYVLGLPIDLDYDKLHEYSSYEIVTESTSSGVWHTTIQYSSDGTRIVSHSLNIEANTHRILAVIYGPPNTTISVKGLRVKFT